MISYSPRYVSLYKSGELKDRARKAYSHLSKCDVCALNCPTNRIKGKVGACRTGLNAKISSYTAHLGEESPISGWRGSGTIFFARCNLRCQYCQNSEISQTDLGQEVEAVDLANIMLRLQERGCHNINFVSPSHVVPQLLSALCLAAAKGLDIPLVYNTGGYDSLPILQLLNGVIDIYMPDMKYSNSQLAMTYSRIPRYTEVNQVAVREMYRQVGDLVINKDGLAVHGLLVRHLVLPNQIAGTEKTANFISTEISKNTYFNIMDQYYPSYNAYLYPEINRNITQNEYQDAVDMARKAGLHRFDLANQWEI